MDRKNYYKIIIPILLSIPLLFFVHIYAFFFDNNIWMYAGAVTSTVILILFGMLLLIKHHGYHKSRIELRSVLDAASEGIYGVDLQGRCTFVNRRCLELLGYEREEDLIGSDMHERIHHSYPDETPYPMEKCLICRAVHRGEEAYSDTEVFWKSDGTCFYTEYRSYPLVAHNEIKGAVITFKDITEAKQAEDRIRYLTFHDPVTGLYNQTFMREEYERLDTPRNYPLSIILGDVNGLKLINDVFGHITGNELLKQVSAAITGSCRADDIIARLGGDEFIILLPQTSEQEARTIMKRIAEAVKKVEVRSIKGSIALGTATKTDEIADFSLLHIMAEEEMYLNKSLEQEEEYAGQLKKIVELLHSKSEREKAHSANVSILCEKIAKQLGLPEEEILRIKKAGYFHDIGKVIYEEEVLNRPSSLKAEEKMELKKHSTTGYRILSLYSDTVDIAKGALDHHEHWDGSGYPKGLNKEEISMQGRVISVAEAYDFRTNPYSKAKQSHAFAMKEIREYAGIKYDPRIVEALGQVMEGRT